MKEDSIFDIPIFGDQGVRLGSNSRTDSYDSALGAYGGANLASNGDVGTNSISTTAPYAIDLDSNASINGDAIIGPGGDTSQAISIDSNVTITGTKSTLPALKELPQIIAPAGLPYQGAISLSSNDTLTISGSGEYSNIILDSNSVLTINTNATIYITGTLSLNSNSQLNISNNSEVTFYINGALHLDSNTAINNLSQDPTKLSVYGTDSLTDVSFDSNSNLYGAIYARKAYITSDSNSNIYGSLIGERIRLDSNATVHYDEALGRETGGPGSGLMEISSWQEK